MIDCTEARVRDTAPYTPKAIVVVPARGFGQGLKAGSCSQEGCLPKVSSISRPVQFKQPQVACLQDL